MHCCASREARRLTLSAAIGKTTPCNLGGQRGHLPWDHLELSAPSSGARDRTKEPFSVRMSRSIKEWVAQLLFNDFTGIHHRNAITELRDNAKVVRDQDDRCPESLAQIP